MTRTIQSVENGVNVKHHIHDDTPRVFADGFGPAMIGFPLTTVTLFQQQFGELDQPNVVDRKVTMILEVPTLAIIELAQNIQRALHENKEQLDASMAQMKTLIEKTI